MSSKFNRIKLASLKIEEIKSIEKSRLGFGTRMEPLEENQNV